LDLRDDLGFRPYVAAHNHPYLRQLLSETGGDVGARQGGRERPREQESERVGERASE